MLGRSSHELEGATSREGLRLPRDLASTCARRYPLRMAGKQARRLVPGMEGAHRDDAAASAALPEVVEVHANESHWWNHASFVLPLLGFLAFTSAGLLLDAAEATGFGLFLGAVLVLQLPVVWFTWRGTATAIVLSRGGVHALHRGVVRRELRWDELERIERVETFGNVRWKLHGRGGRHISIEGEIADVPGLIERAAELSGVRPEGGPA